MPQRSYRANLTAAEYPMLSTLQGRNVIIPDIDQNFSRQLSSPKNKDRDVGIAQPYYMHNVMPTDAGVISVGYNTDVLPPLDTDNTFTDATLIRDSFENVGYFVNTSSGRNYVFTPASLRWIRTVNISPIAGGLVTIAHVNGQSYIFFAGAGCYTYDFFFNRMVPVTLTALNISGILGICASSGYLIAWTNTQVYWSSTIDPTDFTPSLNTGAGGGAVQNTKAAITCCLPCNGGFIIYTKRNAVAATYTNNLQYPFNYQENIGAGGLDNPNLAAFEGNSTDIYAYTTNGLQEISINNASIIFPQVTDFLAGEEFEDVNDITLQFTHQYLTAPMKKKVTIVSNRYFIISYGVVSLTHAIVYDLSLQRFGKVKIPHVDCFEFIYPSTAVVDTPRKSIGFMQQDGTVKVLSLSYNTANSFGVMFIGKYQLDRNHYTQIQQIDIESVQVGSNFTVTPYYTLDGYNTNKGTISLAQSVNEHRRYNCRVTGLNHTIAFSGSFQAHCMVIKFNTAGDIR